MITFTKALPTDTLLNAYVNNVVEFASSVGVNPFKCEIQVIANGKTFNFVITPQQDETFYFDFKTIFKKIVQDFFEDGLNPVLDPADLTTFVYDYSQIYVEPVIVFNVLFDDGNNDQFTTTVKVIQSTNQTIKAKKREIQATDSFAVLSDVKDRTNRVFDMWYFEGYPFDVSIYKNVSGNVSVTNKTNLDTAAFDLPNKVNRLFISDGNTNNDIQSVLNLVTGFNVLEFNSGALSTINLQKIEEVCGIYLKWKNPLGGWSYFLFNQKHQQIRQADDLGYIFNDFQSILNNNRIKNIGKRSNDIYNIGATGVTLEQRSYIETIIDTPKVYLFTGEAFSKAEQTDWISVELNTNSFIIKDYKDRVSDVNFTIELPERFTMVL